MFLAIEHDLKLIDNIIQTSIRIFSGVVSIVIMIIPCFSFQGERGLTGPPGPPGRREEVEGPTTTVCVPGPQV